MNTEKDESEGEELNFSKDLLAAMQEDQQAETAQPTEVQAPEVQDQAGDQQSEASSPSPHALLAQRLGLAADSFQSEDEVYEAAKRTFDHYRQTAAQAEQLRLQNQQYESWLRLQQAQNHSQPAPQQPETPKSWWAPPKYDPNLAAQYIKVNEQGKNVWAEDTPEDVKKSTEAYLLYRKEWNEKLLTDPEAALKPIREQAVREAEERIYSRLRAEQSTQQVTQNLASFANYLVEHDVHGQVLRNPVNGEPVLSRYGQAFDAYDRQLLQSGVQDPVIRQNLVLNQLRGLVSQDYLRQVQGQGQAQAPPVQATPSPDAAAARKLEALQRAQGANRLPDRGGAAQRSQESVPSGKPMRFADLLMEEAGKTGATYEPSGRY